MTAYVVLVVLISPWTTFLHTGLDVHYRAHHLFLDVHCILFMLWWVVKETGETRHGCPCCCRTLTYLWLCLHDGQCSSYVQNSVLSQQYTIVAEALKCTVPMNSIIPVKTYSLYVQLTLSVIYINTHLLNVPLLEENLDIMLKHRLNACAQISDVGVLNYQMLLLG